MLLVLVLVFMAVVEVVSAFEVLVLAVKAFMVLVALRVFLDTAQEELVYMGRVAQVGQGILAVMFIQVAMHQ